MNSRRDSQTTFAKMIANAHCTRSLAFEPMGRLFISFTALLLAVGVAAPAAEFGDKRDKPGEVQKLIVPRELIPPSIPLVR